MSDTPENTARPKRRRRLPSAPKRRNCTIYERHVLAGETQEQVAAAFGISQQRVGQIAARVEAWLATHGNHPLAQRMRLRCARRWDAIWSRAIESFDRSREDREVKKERVARPTTSGAADTPLVTLSETTVRQQNGDPRFLTIAARVAEREDRRWQQAEQEDGLPRPSSSGDAAAGGKRGRLLYDCLPAGLCDLEYLACGLPGAIEGVGRQGDKAISISTIFEQRCAEAFRCLGFEVRELGQGCGRVADCLAVATLERFAVIIDAKVRRRGYTLGTDDRQFCEYATRHSRELALSGIEKVYFAVIGSGFREDDLNKLTGLMTGTPIRSVAFIEAVALMRLVNESIVRRREFRLEEIDRLLFGNKIIRE